MISAVSFGGIHLLQPGTMWTEVAMISGIGTIYGSTGMASGWSTWP